MVPVSSAKAAELVKVFENTFRAVNIALANELALLCDRMELNVWEVLDAANAKPFGIMPFYRGRGRGTLYSARPSLPGMEGQRA